MKDAVATWMMQRGYATGHGDTVEDLLKELEWQAREAGVKAMNEVEKERERCAQLVTNALKRHEESPTVAPVLKRLRARIQHPSPKTNCSDGGHSQGLTQNGSPSASAELTSTT